MGYINGNKILPEELINRIQDYIEGECIYIPKSKKHCKAWGEVSNARFELDCRNRDIYERYISGTTVKKLSEIYCLSTQGIYKIISSQKQRQKSIIVLGFKQLNVWTLSDK